MSNSKPPEAPTKDLFDLVVQDVVNKSYDFKNCPTRAGGPFYEQDVIAALLFSGGVLTDTARILSRRRTRLKEFIDSNADLFELWNEIKESTIDEVEAVVFQAAKQGDVPAGKFILQTIGKHRGYSTRVENTGKDGDPMEFNIKPSEELRRKLDNLSKKLSMSSDVVD